MILWTESTVAAFRAQAREVRPSLLCSIGWHGWRLVRVGRLRAVLGSRGGWVCDRAESCRRCGRVRVRAGAGLPGRIEL